jgi:hypothetical protein
VEQAERRFHQAEHEAHREEETLANREDDLQEAAEARAAAAELAQSCTRPTEPTIPDGSTADQEAMATAGSDVRAFVGDTQEYLKCIEGREQGYGEEITQAQQAVINAIYNAGVDAMQGAADEFNTELDAYRKVHGSGE